MDNVVGFKRRVAVVAVGVGGALLLGLSSASPAVAATTISGPVNLGTAAPFAVLAGSTVTNTGTSVLTGNVGISPGTAVTGFPPGVLNGTISSADTVADKAKSDLTTAYNVAASLTPKTSGLTDLVGKSLVPGVYSGGALSLSGTLTLTGSANSVWVFQAASTLITGSASNIIINGGASACNVFWKVGTSATLGSGSNFTGTILANKSITANTTASITGRLLARTGAVTLDTNTISKPTNCVALSGAVATSPTITSGTPPTPHLDTEYSFRVIATGTPAPTFSVSAGTLPPGLSLNASTGVISGTPTKSGTYNFTITARNGTAPSSSRSYSLTVSASLALTGVDPGPSLTLGGSLIAAGLALYLLRRRRTPAHRL
nr:ice-binding protein [bacterium]